MKRELAEFTPTILIPVGLAVGLLLLGLNTSYPVYENAMLLLLTACVGAALFLFLLKSPQWGLVALIAGGLVVPFEIGTGSQTGLNPVVLLLPVLLGIWVFDMVAIGGRLSLPSGPCMLPLFLFLITAVLAFLAGQFAWSTGTAAPMRAQVAGLGLFFLSAGAFLLAAGQLGDARWLERLIWLFLAIGAFYTTLWLLPFERTFSDVFPPSGGTGSLFWTWLMALAAGQVFFNRRLSKRARLLLIVLLLGVLCVGIFPSRSWMSGWVPPLVALCVLLAFRMPRTALFTGITGGLASLIYLPRLIQVLMNSESYSLLTRLEGWQILAQILKVNPILGLGPANYYHYTSLYSIRGWYVPFNSHNNYIDIVAQLGLLGLVCFLWFFWEVGRSCWRLRVRVPEGFERGYVYGAIGGLAGTLTAAMLGDWVIPFVYNIGLEGFRSSVLAWLFLGGVLAIEHRTPDPPPANHQS